MNLLAMIKKIISKNYLEILNSEIRKSNENKDNDLYFEKLETKVEKFDKRHLQTLQSFLTLLISDAVARLKVKDSVPKDRLNSLQEFVVQRTALAVCAAIVYWDVRYTLVLDGKIKSRFQKDWLEKRVGDVHGRKISFYARTYDKIFDWTLIYISHSLHFDIIECHKEEWNKDWALFSSASLINDPFKE